MHRQRTRPKPTTSTTATSATFGPLTGTGSAQGIVRRLGEQEIQRRLAVREDVPDRPPNPPRCGGFGDLDLAATRENGSRAGRGDFGDLRNRTSGGYEPPTLIDLGVAEDPVKADHLGAARRRG